MEPTIQQLRVFLAVARWRNLSKAATELRTSQPSVSRTLKSLEYALKLKLYRSIGSGIELTHSGNILRNDTQRFILQADDFIARWSCTPSQRRQVGNILKVGGNHGPSTYLLPRVTALFRSSHPEVGVYMHTTSSAVLEQWVLDGQIEFAIVTAASDSPALVVEPYRSEPLAVFISSRHPLARSGTVILRELIEYPFAVRGHPHRLGRVERLLNELTTDDCRPNIVMRCNLPTAVKTFVKEEGGVGILYRDLIEPEVKSGCFRILEVKGLELAGESFILYRKDKPLSANALDFVALMRQQREKNAPKGITERTSALSPSRQLAIGSAQSNRRNKKRRRPELSTQ